MNTPLRLDRLRRFVIELTALLERQPEESVILDNGQGLLKQLVEHDDWLPEQFAEPHPDHYLQYLLHVDPQQRFSVVSFVWGPGQRTPVHDHRVWGMIGMLRGAELGQRFERQPDGTLLPQANRCGSSVATWNACRPESAISTRSAMPSRTVSRSAFMSTAATSAP